MLGEHCAGVCERAERDVSREIVGVVWLGKDASDFKGKWVDEVSPAILELVGSLRLFGEELRHQAAEQDTASAGAGGGRSENSECPRGWNTKDRHGR